MKPNEIELPSNRKFGLFFAVVFAVLCMYSVRKGGGAAAWGSAALALTFVVLGLTRSALLQPLNRLWMHFGLLLGTIVTPVVLCLLFFTLFTPIGLVMRLAGRDELRLRTTSAESYWHRREQQDLNAESLRNQF